jgi:hypothetical protein
MRVGEVETVSMEAPDQATSGLVQLEQRQKPSPGVTSSEFRPEIHENRRNSFLSVRPGNSQYRPFNLGPFQISFWPNMIHVAQWPIPCHIILKGNPNRWQIYFSLLLSPLLSRRMPASLPRSSALPPRMPTTLPRSSALSI